jgi:hypothetical protein
VSRLEVDVDVRGKRVERLHICNPTNGAGKSSDQKRHLAAAGEEACWVSPVRPMGDEVPMKSIKRELKEGC